MLWALGTVLGRYLARDMRFEHVATLALHLRARPRARSRCSSWAHRPSRRCTTRSGSACSRSSPASLALGLYYYGLRSTPAVAATLAELAFPVSATLVLYFKFGQTLDAPRSGSGLAVTSLVVALLPIRPRDTIDVPVPAAAPA